MVKTPVRAPAAIFISVKVSSPPTEVLTNPKSVSTALVPCEACSLTLLASTLIVPPEASLNISPLPELFRLIVISPLSILSLRLVWLVSISLLIASSIRLALSFASLPKSLPILLISMLIFSPPISISSVPLVILPPGVAALSSVLPK